MTTLESVLLSLEVQTLARKPPSERRSSLDWPSSWRGFCAAVPSRCGTASSSPASSGFWRSPWSSAQGEAVKTGSPGWRRR